MIERRSRYWAAHPPVHVVLLSIAMGVFGFRTRSIPEDQGDVDDLRAMFPGGIKVQHLTG